MNDIIHSFSRDFYEILESYKKKDFFSLEITTTELCNCRCSYCFERDGKPSQKMIQYDIEKLARNIDDILADERFLKKYKTLGLTMWGGEPTIAVDEIVYLMNRYGGNPVVSWYIYTNGTLEKNLDIIAHKIREKNISDRASFQFSWDGDPVHDMRRSFSIGGNTSYAVKNSFRKYTNEGIHCTFKATILPDDFMYFSDVWKSYQDFLENVFCGDIPDDIAYAPTIDQTFRGNSAEYIDVLKRELAKICAFEKNFTSKHKRYLMSWFQFPMKTCSYRKNMACVDIFGNVYTCHGVQYEKSVSCHEKLGTIDTTEWIDDILNGNSFPLHIPDECLSCSSTYCAICCAQSASFSKKKTPYERWYDRTCQNGLCEFYRVFGIFDKALHKILIQGV